MTSIQKMLYGLLIEEAAECRIEADSPTSSAKSKRGKEENHLAATRTHTIRDSERWVFDESVCVGLTFRFNGYSM